MTARLFDLTGKVAIVTGGNGGIGLGMARGLAQAGAAIAVVGRNEAKSAEAVAELKQGGAKAIAVTADVTDKEAVAAMVGRVTGELGRIDILVNNAGINIRKPPHALDIAEWNSVIADQPHQRLPVLAGGLSRDEGGRRRQDHQYRLDDVDLRRQLRAGLCRQQRRHRAVHPLLRLAWAADNIQANAVLPGWIDTDLTKRARKEIDGLHDRVLARTPAARWGAIDDFAGIAVFLASPASDFVTGIGDSRRRRIFDHGLDGHQSSRPCATKKPRLAPGLSRLNMCCRSVLGDDRAAKVELVVHADQRLLGRQAGRDDFRGRSGNKSPASERGGKSDVPASEIHIVVFAEYRPAGREHPFNAAADGPALAVNAGSKFRGPPAGVKML